MIYGPTKPVCIQYFKYFLRTWWTPLTGDCDHQEVGVGLMTTWE
jgi:hypothetical protein